MVSKAQRITLYSVLITASIGQIIAGSLSASSYEPWWSVVNPANSPQVYFASISAFVALLTFIWSIILLCFNDAPFSKHPLTRVRAHLYSLVGVAAAWLVLSVLLSSQFQTVCRSTDIDDPACGTAIASAVISWILFIVAACGAFFIRHSFSDASKYDNITMKDTIDPNREDPALGKERSQGLTALVVLYSFIIAFGIAQVGMGIFAALESRGSFRIDRDDFFPPSVVFASITAVYAMWHWIWSSVLIAYINKPNSTSALTRLGPHFWSAAVSTLVWLALAIGFTTQMPYNCQFEVYSDGLMYVWCAANGTAMSLSFVLFFLSAPVAFITGLAANRTGSYEGRLRETI
ncbi:hypothetical protein CYLTODRAFT_377126 [Cylindrobasidium torrendii FP15055 ss-10]|uniref:Uncharacterized protein n=1 Tax=Cylindrobasidium torrendii FP15055 ss-10 TaxID=1314674 RepID=A0A0D7B9M4_9AGAR|nr:hypothetical protein CYLTODRAFT_377126 [Cylindrobasidium torrendii FP15055 ss-10]